MIIKVPSFKEFKKEFSKKDIKKVNFSNKNQIYYLKQSDSYENKSKNNLILKDNNKKAVFINCI